jgi:hypothetical protein
MDGRDDEGTTLENRARDDIVSAAHTHQHPVQWGDLLMDGGRWGATYAAVDGNGSQSRASPGNGDARDRVCGAAGCTKIPIWTSSQTARVGPRAATLGRRAMLVAAIVSNPLRVDDGRLVADCHGTASPHPRTLTTALVLALEKEKAHASRGHSASPAPATAL